jgi:hypothetical protein
MLFTHLFLRSVNEEWGCLENREDLNETQSRLTIVGKELIDTINFFELKAFLRFLNDLQKRRAAAGLALRKEKSKADDPHEDSEGSQEAQGSGDEELEEEASDPEEDEEQEVEPNIARVACNSHPDSALVCKLLADYESVSDLTRT